MMKREGTTGQAIVAIVLLGMAALKGHGQTTAATQASTPAATQSGEASGTQPAVHLIKAPAKADEYLTQEDLVQAYRENQYPLVIRESGRILGNPKLMGAYSLFNVLMLRGESFLQTKNFPLAMEAYEAAAKAAPDADKRAVMVATKTMIEKRTGVKYLSWTTDERGTPIYAAGIKGKQAIAIDMLDLSKREAVFRALCWDQAAEARRDVVIISQFAKLSLVEATMDSLDKLLVLEIAGRGVQEETDTLRKELATAIEAGLSRQVSLQKKRMLELSDMAQQPEKVTTTVRDMRGNSTDSETTRPKGLSVQAVKELEGIMDLDTKIPASVDQVVERLKVEATIFAPLVKQAEINKTAAVGLLERYKEAAAAAVSAGPR